jgi:uncharacterized lipoprotein YmbA
MEGLMDNQKRKENYKFDYEAPPALEFENAADATGFWFAAVVICAVLAAGIIVYRTDSTDFRIATNDAPSAAAQADSVAPPSLPAH